MTFDLDEYLSSSDFNGLCIAMDFLDEDIEEIVEKAVRSAVGDILEMEKKVFSQLNQK